MKLPHPRRLPSPRQRFLFCVWMAVCAFCVCSGLWFLTQGSYINVLICAGTALLTLLPYIMDRFLGLKICCGFYVFCVLYAMGPMLGKAFRLYYTTMWWDKLLHTSGGIVFAAFGAYLAGALNGEQETSPWLRALLGFCFSITVAAMWELCEYGVDCFFAADMQHDTVIHAINSHFLSDVPGGLHSIQDIRSVTVNGVPMEIAGYLDIGLHDTMQDVIVETCGAAVFMIWTIIDRGRHPWITSRCPDSCRPQQTALQTQ